MSRTYFEDELAYLRELGREFSPSLGERGNDADVDRLLEGFAFLTATLREKLDDEFPEFTQGLLALLWPHYLRRIPSMSILEFRPLVNVVIKRKPVPREVEIESVPVDGTKCLFRTCFPVDLYPLEIRHAEIREKGSSLVIDFSLHPGLTCEGLGLDKLRLFLHGETHVTMALYLWLSQHCQRLRRVVVAAAGEHPERREFEIPCQEVRAVGLGEHEGALPYPPNAFLGFRVIQEYWSLPEKFLFFDIGALKRINEFGMAVGFRLTFEFSQPLAQRIIVSRDSFRLHCTPIVNLFSLDADPILVDGSRTEYRVRPSGRSPRHYEVYSVDRVEGFVQGSGSLTRYHSFESFRHDAVKKNDALLYYRTRLRPSAGEKGLETSAGEKGVETYISFVTSGDQRAVPSAESISIRLTCTNRSLGTALRVGDIASPTSSSPGFANFHNIIPVSPSAVPTMEEGLNWRLISNMALSYASLSDIESLREMLKTYDFVARHDSVRRERRDLCLQGLVDLNVQQVDNICKEKGLTVRGLRTLLTMRERNFAGEGDMYLFASVLNAFLSLFARINSFHQLIVVGQEEGKEYRWPPRSGQQQNL